MPENRRPSSARKIEKIGERGFGRVRGPRGYVVVGTIIVVVQVSSKLYGKFRCCDKQYLLFVVLCNEPGFSRFFRFRFCFAFFSCVLLSTFLVIFFFWCSFVAIGACIPLLCLAIIEDAQSLDSLLFV